MRERRGRAKIFVDGELFAELDSDVAAERGLLEGAALSSEELHEARVAGERPLAMARALNILGYRARSEKELGDRLRRHGYVGETVEGVLARLRELGYLDDGEFAREAARQKARRYGPRRVAAELMRGGVDAETARGATEQEFEGRSELEEARAAAGRRYNAGGSDAQARKVYGFLMRRGYSAEVCAEVAREHRGSGEPEPQTP